MVRIVLIALLSVFLHALCVTSNVDEVSYAIQHLGEVQRETSFQIIKLKCQTNRTKWKKKQTI